MLSAKYVQRQIAVIVVIAMIKAPFLFPVQDIVGGIHVQNDLLGGLFMRFQKQIHQQRINALRVHHDLLGLRLVRLLLPWTAVVVWRRQLQAVERAFAGQRFAAILGASPLFALHIILAQRHGQHRIAPQFIVVVEILVAQSQPEHALHDQIQQRVLDQLGVAVVGEASGEALYDLGSLLQFLQHQRSAIGSDIAPIEAPNQLPSSQVLRGFERLSEGVESSRSLQRRDDQSHASSDAGRASEVTSLCKNVLKKIVLRDKLRYYYCKTVSYTHLRAHETRHDLV